MVVAQTLEIEIKSRIYQVLLFCDEAIILTTGMMDLMIIIFFTSVLKQASENA